MKWKEAFVCVSEIYKKLFLHFSIYILLLKHFISVNIIFTIDVMNNKRFKIHCTRLLNA